jgi:hypothetical protein
LDDEAADEDDDALLNGEDDALLSDELGLDSANE